MRAPGSPGGEPCAWAALRVFLPGPVDAARLRGRGSSHPQERWSALRRLRLSPTPASHACAAGPNVCFSRKLCTSWPLAGQTRGFSRAAVCSRCSGAPAAATVVIRARARLSGLQTRGQRDSRAWPRVLRSQDTGDSLIRSWARLRGRGWVVFRGLVIVVATEEC